MVTYYTIYLNFLVPNKIDKCFAIAREYFCYRIIERNFKKIRLINNPIIFEISKALPFSPRAFQNMKTYTIYQVFMFDCFEFVLINVVSKSVISFDSFNGINISIDRNTMLDESRKTCNVITMRVSDKY